MNQELGSVNKITSFTNLDAWKEGHALALMIYKETEYFPKKETFGLVSQMRRSAVSVTSNVAEGFGRQSYKEKIQFYSITQGSVTELQSQLYIAKDVGFTAEKIFHNIMEQSIKVHKIINGLIKGARRFIPHS